MRQRQIDKKFLKAAVLFFLIGATIFRLLLAAKVSGYFIVDAGYDDRLLYGFSRSLMDGEWLGKYGVNTLTKGISFPLFLLVNHLLGLPYSITVILFLIVSSAIFVLAIRPLVKSFYLRSAFYLFLLYTPAAFATEFALRIYRNSITVQVVLLLLAGVIGLYLRRGKHVIDLLPWAGLTTVLLPFFWFLREDSIWFLPLYLVATGLTIIGIIWKKDGFGNRNSGQAGYKKNKVVVVLSVIVCLLPLVSLKATETYIASQNEKNYGVYTTNDRTGTEFAVLMEQLIRLDASERARKEVNEDSTIWISRAALELASEVSPTFSAYQEGINWYYENSDWTAVSIGEIPGDLIFWAIREGFVREGLYKDAKYTQEVLGKITKEIASAYDAGTIIKKDGFYISSLGDGKKLKDLPIVFDYTVLGFRKTLLYEDYDVELTATEGDKEKTKEIEAFLNERFFDSSALETVQKQEAVFVTVEKAIIALYKISAVPLLLLVLFVTLLIPIDLIRKRVSGRDTMEYGIMIYGLLLTYLLLIIGVAWFVTWSVGRAHQFMLFYTSAGVIMMQLVEIFCISYLFSWYRTRKNRGKEQELSEPPEQSQKQSRAAFRKEAQHLDK